jgi:hypothetical protein
MADPSFDADKPAADTASNLETDAAFDAQARRDKAAQAQPMASAPMKFDESGAVAWGDMWDSFCVLASAGGPAHRATMLEPGQNPDPDSAEYRAVVAELTRGIALVSGLRAVPAEPGWLRIECPDGAMSAWIVEQGVQENVHLRLDGAAVLAPIGAAWTIKGEIKNVITVIAKTTHYWQDHLAAEMKSALAVERALAKLGGFLRKARKKTLV